jgi:hypothetical protein
MDMRQAEEAMIVVAVSRNMEDGTKKKGSEMRYFRREAGSRCLLSPVGTHPS